MYKIFNVYSDSKGDSHFGEVLVPLKDAGDIGKLSEIYPAKGIIFREVEPTYDFDYHLAPQRQFIILLDGEIEIETSLGDKRIFKGGDILLMEDTEGKGHRTKNLTPIRRKSIFVILD